MAWDSSAATAASRRRRQNSTSAGRTALPLHTKTPSVAAAAAAADPDSTIQSTFTHVSDPFLQDFLRPGFDPAAYWNAALGSGRPWRRATPAPPTSTSSSTPTSIPPSTAADLAARAQATLSPVSAHTARLAAVLTQLTDDMLRSGSRLAYEVELLRGEAIGLGEVVVQHETALGAAAAAAAAAAEAETAAAVTEPERRQGDAAPEPRTEDGGSSGAALTADEPAALAQLRMLAQVRARLDAVIHTFGDAMEFVMPPSALSVSASFLSVSGPDPTAATASGGGSDAVTPSPASQSHQTSHDNKSMSIEDKGQQVLRERRAEIVQLLAGGADGPADSRLGLGGGGKDDGTENAASGVAAAAARVNALRALCRVWAGTAEEKARVRFVDSLQRLVEERQRELDRERERIQRQQQRERPREAENANGGGSGSGSGSGQTPPARTGSPSTGGTATPDGSTTSASRGYAAAGYGFISQLQKIRSGL